MRLTSPLFSYLHRALLSVSENFKGYLVVCIMALGLASCTDAYVFKANHIFQQGQWAYVDTVDFKIPVADTTQLYNLYIEFVHADTFPNQNIYLKLYTRFPDGKRVQRIRSFDLYNLEGKVSGKCSGSTCTTKLLLQDNLYFNQLGEHLLTLEQFTRTNPLGGIKSVGVLLEKMDKKR